MACGSKGEHYIPLKQRVGPNFKICFASSSVATRTVSETGCRMLGVFEVKNEILIWRWNYERSPIRANFSDSTILDCRESLLECILQRASDCTKGDPNVTHRPKSTITEKHQTNRRTGSAISIRKTFGDPKPAVALEYCRRFRETEDPDALLEFLEKHPVEFDCSGWVCTAFGYIALGFPRRSECETRARKLFESYWRRIKRSKYTNRQILALVQTSVEKKKFSASSPHRTHFQHATRWLAKRLADGEDDSFAAFRS